MKRFEQLLNKCKETIAANKERTKQLTADRESVSKQLQVKTEELDKLRVCHVISVYTNGECVMSLVYKLRVCHVISVYNPVSELDKLWVCDIISVYTN